jgi:alanyl-tRNA synthetase
MNIEVELDSTILGFMDHFGQNGYWAMDRPNFEKPVGANSTFPFCCAMFYEPFYRGQESSVLPCKQAIRQYCIREDSYFKIGSTPKHLSFFHMLGLFDFDCDDTSGVIQEILSWLTKDIDPCKLSANLNNIFVQSEIDEIFRKIGIKTRYLENLWWETSLSTKFRGPRIEINYSTDSDEIELWNIAILDDSNHQVIDSGGCAERLYIAQRGLNSVFSAPFLANYIDRLQSMPREAKPYFYGNTDQRRENICHLHLVADHIRSIQRILYEGILPTQKYGRKGQHLRSFFRRMFAHVTASGLNLGSIISLFDRKFADIIAREVGIFRKANRFDLIDETFDKIRGVEAEFGKLRKRYLRMSERGTDFIKRERRERIKKTSIDELRSLTKIASLEILLDWCNANGIEVSLPSESTSAICTRNRIHKSFVDAIS